MIEHFWQELRKRYQLRNSVFKSLTTPNYRWFSSSFTRNKVHDWSVINDIKQKSSFGFDVSATNKQTQNFEIKCIKIRVKFGFIITYVRLLDHNGLLVWEAHVLLWFSLWCDEHWLHFQQFDKIARLRSYCLSKIFIHFKMIKEISVNNCITPKIMIMLLLRLRTFSNNVQFFPDFVDLKQV